MPRLSFFVVTLSLALAASPALAYIGPGPGLSMLGSFFTLIAGVAIALLMVLLYPIRLVIKKFKSRKTGGE